MPPYGQVDLGTAEISFLIISKESEIVKQNFCIFRNFFGYDVSEVICLKIWKKAVLFYLGGCVYVTIELLWRGWSHGSMFLAGGLCFLLIGHLGQMQPVLPVAVRTVLGAGIITMVELASGMLFNRSYQVWDYRSQPGNFMGQICPVYSLLWIPVSLAAMVLYDFFSRRLEAKIPGR